MRVKGFTLLEILVTILLSSLLLLSVIQAYIMTKDLWRYQDALSTIESNARAANKLLGMDIKQAGYVGCANLSNITIHNSNKQLELNSHAALSGDEHHIEVKGMSSISNQVLKVMWIKNQITVEPYPSYKAKQWFIVSNCHHGDIFYGQSIAANAKQQIITSSTMLSDMYNDSAELALLKDDEFFIAKTGRKNNQGKDIKALYQRDIHGVKHELIDGVSQMSILYHVSYNSGFQSASSITNWSLVNGVQIALDFNSINQINAHDGVLHRTIYFDYALKERH